MSEQKEWLTREELSDLRLHNLTDSTFDKMHRMALASIELREDAERWRYLREEKSTGIWPDCFFRPEEGELKWGAELDAAIDAARRQEARSDE